MRSRVSSRTRRPPRPHGSRKRPKWRRAATSPTAGARTSGRRSPTGRSRASPVDRLLRLDLEEAAGRALEVGRRSRRAGAAEEALARHPSSPLFAQACAFASVGRMPWQAVETIPFRVGADVAPARAAAIRDALLRRAVPLSRLVDGRLEPLATASLVIDGSDRAVLTAAHVFEQASVGDLVIPLPREGRLLMLRSTRMRVVAHPQLDIALLWFADRTMSERLCANWTACPLRALVRCAARAPRRSMRSRATPPSNARRADGRVYIKPVVLFTGALDGVRYAYARTAMRVDGLEIHTPELDGVSGATVWAVESERDRRNRLRAAACGDPGGVPARATRARRADRRRGGPAGAPALRAGAARTMVDARRAPSASGAAAWPAGTPSGRRGSGDC